MSIRYVALLRGIMPMNPNMKSAKLKEFFESLGFKKVHTVIASGNVVFDSSSDDAPFLEAKIESELPKKLKFESTTIIRTQRELEQLVKKDPFKGVEDKRPNYLVVTFSKHPRTEICTVINLNETDGSTMMRSFEKKHGKAITTRTWKTVHRILKKMENE